MSPSAASTAAILAASDLHQPACQGGQGWQVSGQVATQPEGGSTLLAAGSALHIAPFPGQQLAVDLSKALLITSPSIEGPTLRKHQAAARAQGRPRPPLVPAALRSPPDIQLLRRLWEDQARHDIKSYWNSLWSCKRAAEAGGDRDDENQERGDRFHLAFRCIVRWKLDYEPTGLRGVRNWGPRPAAMMPAGQTLKSKRNHTQRQKPDSSRRPSPGS